MSDHVTSCPEHTFTFDVLRSVVFFYIKTPLRVKEAGLEELILTTWWPTHFDKEVKQLCDLWNVCGLLCFCFSSYWYCVFTVTGTDVITVKDDLKLNSAVFI